LTSAFQCRTSPSGPRSAPSDPLVVGTPDPTARAKPAAPRRGSWGPEQNAAIKPATLNFDAERTTPVKERPALSTPVKDRAGGATLARERGAAATPGRERAAAASSALSSASVRKSSSVLPRLTRSQSFVAGRDQQHPRIPKSPFPTVRPQPQLKSIGSQVESRLCLQINVDFQFLFAQEKSSVSCTASRATRRVTKEEEPSSPPFDDELRSSATSTKKRSAIAARVPVPGKLSLLGKVRSNLGIAANHQS
jgi:hypothetical protein